MMEFGGRAHSDLYWSYTNKVVNEAMELYDKEKLCYSSMDMSYKDKKVVLYASPGYPYILIMDISINEYERIGAIAGTSEEVLQTVNIDELPRHIFKAADTHDAFWVFSEIKKDSKYWWGFDPSMRMVIEQINKPVLQAIFFKETEGGSGYLPIENQVFFME